MAKCPVHREKTASLSIKEGKKSTLLHCFGCLAGGRQVMECLGFTVSDLYFTAVPDKKALREAEQKRAAEERELRRKRWAIGRQIDIHRYWRKQADGLAKALMDRPQSDRLNALFLSALDKARMLDESVVTQMCQLNAKFHKDDFMWGV